MASIGRRVVYGGVEQLTIRLTDDTLTLTPAWMMRPEAAMCAVWPFPRLCVGRLRDLRNHLDALLGSGPGDSSRARGADHAPEATPRAGPCLLYTSDSGFEVWGVIAKSIRML